MLIDSFLVPVIFMLFPCQTIQSFYWTSYGIRVFTFC